MAVSSSTVEAKVATPACGTPQAGTDRPVQGVAPCEQEWASCLEQDDDDLLPQRKIGRGKVRQITHEVTQDPGDDSKFEVDGKDRSWFIQKGALMFECSNPTDVRLSFDFLVDAKSRFGESYAELSRSEQQSTINWLLMAGVAPVDYELTGYRDCKAGGFYFLFHLNYRRTRWRIIGCPHNAEIEDAAGKLFTCNPQEFAQFEILAYEGQTLGVEYRNRELWILNGGTRVARGYWAQDADSGKLPKGDYRPVVLTSNCPTKVHITVE